MRQLSASPHTRSKFTMLVFDFMATLRSKALQWAIYKVSGCSNGQTVLSLVNCDYTGIKIDKPLNGHVLLCVWFLEG